MKDHGIVYGTPAIPPKRLGDPWSAVNEIAAKREREKRKPRLQRTVERMMESAKRERKAFEEISIARLMWTK
jgi:hypothetical protein